ncbi:stage II sporulation protein M [Paenibacillus koleovorans]|uniref:stage II sporulation protein M n=1 Tax=Paenibacillus koleovorans TaxID=121608 RepID=UPI0013E407D2|nr:stage II sporulation protein M [Paenibacillus koleovorans]
MFQFRLLFRYMAATPKYMIAAALVFLAGVVLGYAYSEQFDAFLREQIEGLRELAQSISNKPHSQLYLFGFIFLNNAFKSLLIVFSGVLLAFVPIFFLVINGMIIGYLAFHQAEADQLGLLLKGILPHGVIEIPAIIVASAFGIRLGAIMFKGLLSAFSSRGRTLFREEMRMFWKIAPALCVLLVGSLLVAAIIESTFTPWLMQQ